MKLIVCLDDKMGMAFNKRRQSRDSVLIKDIEAYLEGAALYAEEYSLSLFEASFVNVTAAADVFSDAGKDDTVFLERIDPAPYADKIDKICIYRWNRHYPSDVKFTLDMKDFALLSQSEFAGSSHEKITKEVWIKRRLINDYK